MSCGTCTGACCAVFEYADPERTAYFEGIEDAEFIADMLVPLSLEEAADRASLFGSAYWSDRAMHDWDGRSLQNPNRRLMTCRHWDEETRLCGVYEDRPAMCREYPYYGDCDHSCGFKLTFEQMWNRHLRLNGPEAGTPPNIIRSEN